jgi:hypothetical protein
MSQRDERNELIPELSSMVEIALRIVQPLLGAARMPRLRIHLDPVAEPYQAGDGFELWVLKVLNGSKADAWPGVATLTPAARACWTIAESMRGAEPADDMRRAVNLMHAISHALGELGMSAEYCEQCADRSLAD